MIARIHTIRLTLFSWQNGEFKLLRDNTLLGDLAGQEWLDPFRAGLAQRNADKHLPDGVRTSFNMVTHEVSDVHASACIPGLVDDNTLDVYHLTFNDGARGYSADVAYQHSNPPQWKVMASDLPHWLSPDDLRWIPEFRNAIGQAYLEALTG